MSRSARVESFDQIKTFRVALCKFVVEIKNALAEAESEIMRKEQWLRQDQHTHWKAQIRSRNELMHRAKTALLQKQETKTPLGGRATCVEERKALVVAQRRFAEAEQKLANVQRWARKLDEESFAFKGKVQPLAHAVEVDARRAFAMIDHVLDALAEYTRLQPPSEALVNPVDDAGAPMSRAAPVSVGVEDAAALRKRTPDPDIRDAALDSDAQAAWLAAFAIEVDCQVAIGEIEDGRATYLPRDRVVLACGRYAPGRIYLERIASPAPQDSGWFVGFADNTEIGSYASLRVADVLAVRPDWEELLTLPTGSLVVCNEDRTCGVWDAENRVLWPRATTGVNRP
jgi:hypothetical protein